MADYIKPVIFRLGNQQFGVDINLVQSIEREINIVRVMQWSISVELLI